MDRTKKILVMNMLELAFESEDEDDKCTILLIDTSSEESENDERDLCTLALSRRRTSSGVRIPRIENYVERIVPRYSDEQFKSHFRMYPATYRFLLGLVGSSLISTNSVSGKKPISAEKQLLLSIWMMATPDSYRSVCEKFNVGRATALRALRRVTHALHCVAPRFIQWPQGERANEVMREFERVSAFPNVIGAIDGTHVEIPTPQTDGQSYINRKGYSSIQVQAICTQNMLFTSVFAGHAGSVHDARVFRTSPVRQYFENAEVYFPNDSHLVGDAAYGVHHNLMVPFKDNGHLTARQRNFNYCLSSARISIERAFGLWKNRWRSVLDRLPMISLEKIPEYILATCVLHNICILQGDMIEFNHEPDNAEHARLMPERLEDGNGKRTRLMNSLVMRDN